MPYDIITRYYPDLPTSDFVVLHHNVLLPQVRNMRKLSGDIVVHAGTNNLLMSDVWFWDWEKRDPNCYAQKLMAQDKRILHL